MPQNLVVIILLLLSFFTNAQNLIDAEGKKQGHWIIYGEDKGLPGYGPAQKFQEGEYKDSKKEGLWTEYFSNGNIKNTITFVGNRPSGPAKIYYEDGKINEEGTWKKNRWVGDYKIYDKEGNAKEYCFDSIGKGRTIEHIRMCSFSHYDILRKDSVLTCIVDGVAKPINVAYKFDSLSLGFCSCSDLRVLYPQVCPDKWTLYNKNKQLSKCGYFDKGRLYYGLAYQYDEDGVLKKIIKYYNGKCVGECIVE